MSSATLDHYIPVSRGGSHQVTNLVLSCLKCNQGKKDDII